MYNATLHNPHIEELINAITHGFGTALSVAALIIMLYFYHNDSTWHLMSCIIYGSSLIILYLASTLYHSFTNTRLKSIFKVLDHTAIYILIAGNYTPFTLIPLHGKFGWTIFSIIWGLAAIGCIFQLFYAKRFKLFSTICYLLMGWFAAVMIRPLLDTVPPETIYWLIIGGLFYTIGTIFYLINKIPYHHAIWHIFVMAGSAAHFVAIAKYVLPLPITIPDVSLILNALC